MFAHVVRIVPAGAVSQDHAAIRDLGSTLVLALADGAGGMGGGAHAARRAVEVALAAASGIDPRDPQAWGRILAELDGRLEADPEAGETTLVVVAAWDGGAAGASVGDSGAWLVGDAVRDLTHAQRRKPLLGSGSAVATPFAVTCDGGTLLVASDGLFKYAAPETIERLVRGPDLETAAEQLVAAVRLPSGELWDDVAVVLCRRDGHGGCGIG